MKRNTEDRKAVEAETAAPMKSISRCLDVLECLMQPGRTLTDVAKETGLPFSTVHRILDTLRARDYVLRSEDQRYFVGSRLLYLVERAGGKAKYLSIVAADLLQGASDKTQETVSLAIYENYKVTFIEQIQPSHSMRVILKLGESYPLYATAAGKAVLASMANDELDWYLKGAPFAPLTKRTLTSAREICDELDDIRKRGYAIENQESEANIVSTSAVISDRSITLGAVSISGPIGRVGKHKIGFLGEMSEATARAISERIRV